MMTLVKLSPQMISTSRIDSQLEEVRTVIYSARMDMLVPIIAKLI